MLHWSRVQQLWQTCVWWSGRPDVVEKPGKGESEALARETIKNAAASAMAGHAPRYDSATVVAGLTDFVGSIQHWLNTAERFGRDWRRPSASRVPSMLRCSRTPGLQELPAPRNGPLLG